ncbi:MAG TPA: DUF4270 family protein [Flavitalea sp.]|nr:DUF4270 family protein [Flavitalea sp.]
MKKNISGPVIVALTLFFISSSSCTKIDTTDLGNELIPAVDNVNTFETVLDIETNNLLFSSDTTEIPYNIDHAVGIIESDPDFGRTDAALYFDVSPAAYKAYPFGKKDSIVAIDSVVLSLAFKGLYGDSNSVQRFEVFEINPNESFRYSNTNDYQLNHPDFAVIPTALGARTVDFKVLNDSVHYINAKDTVRTTNELRIHLNTAFATRFINADTTTAYSNDSIFKKFFNGFAVKTSNSASPQKNGLAYLDLTDAKTKVTFYCRTKEGGTITALAPSFRYFNNNGTTTSTIGGQANLIKRTPANGYLANVTNGNANDQMLYLQSTPGSYVTLKIPGIDTLTNRVIHRAEIVVEKLIPVSETFTTPDLLFIDVINAKGDSAFTVPNDFVRTGNNTYDVNLIGGKLKDNKYTFNISRHLQNIVTNKKPNYTLRIYAPFITQPYIFEPVANKLLPTLFLINPRVAYGRVIVGGGNHPTKKMRLRIIYSKI